MSEKSGSDINPNDVWLRILKKLAVGFPVETIAGDLKMQPNDVWEIIGNIRAIAKSARSEAEIMSLTNRERQVLEKMGRGADNKDIALQLGISYETVKE